MGSAATVVKDAVIALAVVGAMLFGIFAYSGVWPPVVVVESGSMMHADAPFGKLATIDPGDLVIVKDVANPGDIAYWADRTDKSYSDWGDVIVYYRRGDESTVPIIHRAMTYVDVDTTGRGVSYRLKWPAGLDCGNGQRSGDSCVYGSKGIYLPLLGFDEHTARGFTKDAGYRPPSSGIITKGDNPVTNDASDQASGLSPSPVQFSWIAGKGRGELPWLGLLKLAVAPQVNEDNPPSDWLRIGNCYAPTDLWAMLAIAIASLVALPVGVDAVRDWRAARKNEDAARSRGAPPPDDHDADDGDDR